MPDHTRSKQTRQADKPVRTVSGMPDKDRWCQGRKRASVSEPGELFRYQYQPLKENLLSSRSPLPNGREVAAQTRIVQLKTWSAKPIGASRSCGACVWTRWALGNEIHCSLAVTIAKQAGNQQCRNRMTCSL